MNPAHNTSDLREDYAALDLNPGATLDEVRGAYRRLARALHPDLNPGAAGTLMARINRAYANLSRRLEGSRPPARPAAAGQGQGWSTYHFEDFGAQAAGARAARPEPPASERPAPGDFSSPSFSEAGPTCGLGPLGGGPQDWAADGPAPRPPHGSAPLWEDRGGGWRLLGIRLEGQDVVYQVEVSGRARSLTLPVRCRRACRQCEGAGHQLTRTGLAPCPACGGKGSFLRPEMARVDIPRRWLPGLRLPVQACSEQGSILVELRRAKPEGSN